MYEVRVRKVAAALQGRLDPVLTDGALDYLEHNEARLGFEILCDTICEYDVLLSDAEHLDLVALGSDYGLNLRGPRFSYVAELRT